MTEESDEQPPKRDILFCRYDAHRLDLTEECKEKQASNYHRLFTCPLCGRKYRYMKIFVEVTRVGKWEEFS